VPPKFLLDEQVSPEVARLAGKAGVDVRAVAASELAGLDDKSIFRKAVEGGRVLVSYNIDDMSLLLGDFLKEGAPVAGVVFVDRRTIPPSDVPGLARALVKLANKMEKGEVDPGGGIFLQR
jgi:predicted nuclease of predicted toxin-antitoxin system